MSRGLGRVERLVLEYLTGFDDEWEGPYIGTDETTAAAITIANRIFLSRDDWFEPSHRSPRPTPSQFRSCLRAIKSLERKRLLKTWREDGGAKFDRGRRDMLCCRLTTDYAARLSYRDRIQFARGEQGLTFGQVRRWWRELAARKKEKANAKRRREAKEAANRGVASIFEGLSVH